MNQGTQSMNPTATNRHALPDVNKGLGEVRRSEANASAAQALERLASYRSAAQAVRREPTRLGVRLSKLIELRQAASRESDPFIRSAGEAIIWAQAEWLIQGQEALMAYSGHDPIERAARRLRASGRETCPTCEQRLSDPADWQWWASLRRHELERLAALDREPEAGAA